MELGAAQPYASTSQAMSNPDSEWVRKMLFQNRDLLAQLEIENPELAKSINDPVKFEQVFFCKLAQLLKAFEASTQK
jgi:hypothetical protein